MHATLDGRVEIVLFAFETLDVNMDTVKCHLNANVNLVGLDHNVKEVLIKIQRCQIENQQSPFYVVNRGPLNHD